MEQLNDVGENSNSFETMKQELLQKKIRAEERKNDKKAQAGACNDLATFYFKYHCYDDALREFEAAARICERSGFQMEWATCNRMIGEIYMMKADFALALLHVEKYMTKAIDLKDLVEQERAMGTIGRIHLLQGQSSTNKTEIKTSIETAEKYFMESLKLCEKLEGKIGEKELMDMRARALLNIGVVQECLESFDKALLHINNAIVLCKTLGLYEVLHMCYTSMGLLYLNKKKDNAQALSCFEQALGVVDQLEDKVLKKCETLALKAEVLCKMSEYKRAKQALLKAWKLKSPNQIERKEIKDNLKVGICYIQEFIITFDQSDHSNMKKMYDRLGDSASYLQNYEDAVEYYLKMLQHAEQAGERGKELAPIYVSLYKTYQDMGRYREALLYLEKEYELIKDMPKEAFSTLYNKAEVLFLAKKPYDLIERACLDTRKEAKKLKRVDCEIKILKKLLKYQIEYKISKKVDLTKVDLMTLGCNDLDLENFDEEPSSQGSDNVTSPDSNEICLEFLTDEETEIEEQHKETKRKRK